MMRKLTTTLGILAGVMLLALPAFGHVTVRTDNAEPGGFAVYTVRVPNESDTGSTIRIEVQLPDGLEASRYQPKPGWNMTIANGVLLIEGGAIAPGQFEEFRFQARNPEAPGAIAFPAVQTYDDGEVVNWTGEPESDTPASVVEIASPASGEDTPEADAEPTDTLTIVALVLGGLGVVLGGAALFRPRKA
jgi:uncharacterized protein YcnI